MRILSTFAIFAMAMSFCGLQERLTGSGNSGQRNSSSDKVAERRDSDGGTSEKAKPSAAHQTIIDTGVEASWSDQGIAWKLPATWKRSRVEKESFNYGSPDNAFLIVSISVMPDSFPMDVSLKAYHEQALQQLKNGKYESAKLVEIDGITGVEFVETPPADKTDSRRHQWIGYRDYLGQKQQVNIMLATRGTNFEKHLDTFQAIIYSTKFTK